ncbi:PhnD/SsuA/transferrin family substrate-binding protein [Sphingobium cloacae]|nr:PhnD/SsuA/transferrin family substrate-binding protein [Sphingobium cloacae]
MGAPLMLAACRAGVGDGGSSTLRIGDQSKSLQLPFELAGEVEGPPLPFQWMTFTDGPNMNAAFLSDALDVGTMGDTPALFASAAGADVVIIAAGSTAPNSYLQIIARPDTGIRTLADLKGKRIAFTKSTALHGYLLLALEHAGLSQADITPIDVPLVALMRALQSEAADAAVLGGPMIPGYLAQQPDAVVLDAPDGGYNVILAARRSLAHPTIRSALVDFVARGARAGEWLKAHPDIWREEYFRGVQHQDEAGAQALLKRVGIRPYFKTVTAELRTHLERQAKLLSGAGALPPGPIAADLFDGGINREFNQAIEEAIG